jgi:hypothetical protein
MHGPPLLLAGVRSLFAAVLVVCFLAACGGSSGGSGTQATSTSVPTAKGSQLPGWVKQALSSRGGPDVAATMGSQDFAVGVNRVVFIIVRGNGSLVDAPKASVTVGPPDAPQRTVEARLLPLGHAQDHHQSGQDADHLDVSQIFVAQVRAPKPGRYWFVADPAGEELQAVGTLDVAEHASAPAVGSKAPASDNPTLADAPATQITTADPPDTELLRYSVAGSIHDHVPFVVVFATPAFCVSRVCGPTVEVVQAVAKHFQGSGIRFIHVEIYTDNDPKRGFNRWVREWNLPTEPWTFLVDGRGVVRSRFEGAVSAGELEGAVRAFLRPQSGRW